MNSFKSKTISQFINLLSSNAPTPGGGTSAGIAGAISASLICMVANLTIGKKGYETSDKEMKKIIVKAKKYQKELLVLADEDSKAYEAVVSAYKISKENPKRAKEIQESLKYAIEVPLKTANICEDLIHLAEKSGEIGNKNAFSDAKSAEYLAVAGKKSALENVKINLPFIKDEAWKKRIVLTKLSS